MYTTGQAITNAARFYMNPGSDEWRYDAELRARGHFYLTQVCQELWTFAPNWFKEGDGTVTLTNGVGSLPNDFNTAGNHGSVWLASERREVIYEPSDALFARLVGTPSSGAPRYWTLADKDGLGVGKVYCWPTDNSTLTLKRYDRCLPELIDFPVAPTLTLDETAGNLTGDYQYRVSFVTASGETEGGSVTDPMTTASQQIDLSVIPVSEMRTVTSRKLYRTAGGGIQYKLLATISDNLTTTYADNIVDASLGANVLTPASALYTGLEVFPKDFHESLIMKGLREATYGDVGDPREFSLGWRNDAKRLWSNQRPGQNQPQVMPVYGQGSQGMSDVDYYRLRIPTS